MIYMAISRISLKPIAWQRSLTVSRLCIPFLRYQFVAVQVPFLSLLTQRVP